MRKIFLSILAGFFAPGCAILETTPWIGTDEISRNIGENATKLNDAHSRALNGVILQNILRARDRWPKHYTVLSGITSEPQVTLNVGAEFTPIGLGNPKGPFTGSGVSGSQDSTSAFSYQSNPLEQSDNAYIPIRHDIFARYWNDGWPKDVLLMVLVKSITIGDERYVNSVSNKNDHEKYWRAVTRLLPSADCNRLININVKISDQSHPSCSELITVVLGDGKEVRRELRRLQNDNCSREVAPDGQTVTATVQDCSLKYVKRELSRSDAECPVVESYARLHLMNNRDSGSGGILSQIEKLRLLYGGNVHVRRNPDSALGDVFEVRLCESMKKESEFEFVRVDDAKAGEFLKLDKAQAFSSNQTGYSRWTGIRLELRSIDDILNYLGEWLRTHGDNGERSPEGFGDVVLNSQRCHADILSKVTRTQDVESKQTTPLFRVVSKDLARSLVGGLFTVDENHYAINVEHAGDTYLAVAKPRNNVDMDCSRDRTSAVFALLSQLYIRSQSAAFLRAPDGTRVRTQ